MCLLSFYGLVDKRFHSRTVKMVEWPATPDLKKILKANGCYFKRQAKGDHEFWFSPITNRSFSVDDKIVSRHSANEVLKQAGLEKRF